MTTNPNPQSQGSSSTSPIKHGPSSTTPENHQTNAVGAEDEDARKARVNSELVQLLQTPSLPGRTASVQGFGIYTHARIKRVDDKGDTQDTSEVMFLPVGGPNKVRKGKIESEPPIDGKVQKIWNKVEEAVDEEETHLNQRNINLERLKKRYGALEAPENNTTAKPDAQLQQQQHLQQWIEYLSRRTSNAGQTSGDVAMGGTEQETTGSNLQASKQSHVAPSRGNLYHQERDPRKQYYPAS